MLKNVQQHLILWIQARTGVTPTFVAWTALSIVSAAWPAPGSVDARLS
jgi:hypothetical protein